MGVTRFPNGIEVGDSTTAGTFSIGGTAITNPLGNDVAAGKSVAYGTIVVPSGTAGTVVASGLTTVDYVVAGPYSTVPTVAGFAGVAVSASAGNITLLGISGAGTISTANGTATWIAYGS